VDTLEAEQIGRFVPLRIRAGGVAEYAEGWSDYRVAGAGTPGYPNINDDNPPAGFVGDPAGPLWVNDYAFDPSFRVNPGPPITTYGADWEPYWRYRWAMDLFDFLDVRSPATDTLPNYPVGKQWEYSTQYYPGDVVSFLNTATKEHHLLVCTIPHTSVAAGGPFLFPPANFVPIAPVPHYGEAVQNGAGVAAFPGVAADENAENHEPFEGKVNINTAGWRALATLPLVVQGPGDPSPGYIDNRSTTAPPFRNDNMAKAIVYFRDVDGDPNPAVVAPHGPFRSIFELNKVMDLRSTAAAGPPAGYPAGTPYTFQNGFGTIELSTMAGTTGPDDVYGDHSPLNTVGVFVDAIRGDYEERFLQMNRISNLITTRSDSFTCYILLQGWRNADTTSAELVVQRRVGYLVDRSRLTPATADGLIKQAFLNR
jgi:hypothetical protein